MSLSSGPKTQTFPKRDPNFPDPEGLKQIQEGLLGKVMEGLETYDPAGWKKASEITDRAQEAQLGLIDRLPGALDRNDSILDEMLGVVRTGEVPTAFTDRINSAVTKDLQGGMGNMLNSLGNRGVLNSSITSQGVSRLGQQAADAYNKNYLNAFNSVINGYAQGLQGAQGNAQTLVSGANALGSIPSQAYEGATAALMPAFNMWKHWRSSYDGREDYDRVVSGGGGGCVTGDTLVTLSTGEDIPVSKLGDSAHIMAWDFEKGEATEGPLTAFYKSVSDDGYDVIRVCFEDGTDIGVIREHLFFDVAEGQFVAVNKDNLDFVGHAFAKVVDGKVVPVEVTDIRFDGKAQASYAPQVRGHLNFLAGGFITGNHGQLGLCNRFEFDVDRMRYDPVKKTEDLERYGTLGYIYLESVITKEFFDANRCREFSVAFGKELLTLDEFKVYLKWYNDCFFE